jgi:hypothetical protein
MNNIICNYCHNVYDITDIGSLSCQTHPIPYDVKKRVYPCCNTRNPKGCTNIDHYSSVEEYNEIIKFPFCIIPIKNNLNLKILKKYNSSEENIIKSKEPYIIPITNFDQLNDKIKLIIFKDKVMEYELSMLYENSKNQNLLLTNHNNNSKFLGFYISRLNDEEEQNDIDEPDENNIYDYSDISLLGELEYNYDNTNFKPFYIIRRMEYQPNIIF